MTFQRPATITIDPMKKITLLYNPTAGNGNHSARELASSFSEKENQVEGYSTDDAGWEASLHSNPDLLVVAGGDGTVQKVTHKLLAQKRNIPIRIYPIGTANNMARALHALFSGASWNRGAPVALDAGAISGIRDSDFFVESLGFGVFPAFVRAIKNEKDQDSLKTDRRAILQYFLDVLETYDARKADIHADGVRIKGEFLLIQLFNIRFLGPNLPLAPAARPNDGYFDLLLVPAGRKKEFKTILMSMIHEEDREAELGQFGIRLPCREVSITTANEMIQVDDDIADYSGETLTVRLLPGPLTFFRNMSL